MTETKTLTDDEVRAQDAARVGVTGAPSSARHIIDSPANQPKDGERAPERAVYEDRNGRRRVVGAGDVIPRGFSGPVESTPIGERGARTPIVHPENGIGNLHAGGRSGSDDEAGSDDDDGDDGGRKANDDGVDDKAERGPREGTRKPASKPAAK